MTSRTSTTKWLSAPFREDGFVGLINISRTKKAKRFIRRAGADRTERLSGAATKRIYADFLKDLARPGGPHNADRSCPRGDREFVAWLAPCRVVKSDAVRQMR